MARDPSIRFTRLPDKRIAVEVLGTVTSAVVTVSAEEFATAVEGLATNVKRTKKRANAIRLLMEGK